MARTAQFQMPARVALVAALLLLPAATLYNALVPPPHLGIYFLQLFGVTNDLPITLSAHAITSGEFQKAFASRAGEKIPLRPLLIRFNNQILYSLFHEIRPRSILEGAHGHLFETRYMTDYCSRTDADARTYAEAMIPVLRDIQAYYRSRGAVFVYAISPSKVAAMPDYFVGVPGTLPCPNSVATRLNSTVEYAQRVRDAGIATLDLATMLRDARQAYPIDLFSPGGSHWNDLGAAIATNAVIAAINAQLTGPPLRSIPSNYAMSHDPVGADVDVINVLALLFPPRDFAVPKIAFAADCPATPTSTLPAAIVGSSFMHHTVEFMERGACMGNLKLYFYYRNMLLGGLPYRILKQGLDADDLAKLRDMKIVVLEENESQIGRSGYPQAFHDLLLAK